MAYIPTIRTFQDDLQDNRQAGELGTGVGVEDIVSDQEILPTTDETKSTAKIILVSISVIFILASITTIVYYFFNQRQGTLDNITPDIEIQVNADIAKKQAGVTEDIKNIFPNLLANTKINFFIESIKIKDNVIIAKISKNQNGESNYNNLYTTIVANEKDFNKDLIMAFKLNGEEQKSSDTILTDQENTTDLTATSTSDLKPDLELSISTTTAEKFINSTTSKTVSKKNSVNSDADDSVLKLKEINEMVWLDKTTNNQDYKVTDSGVSALIYGYVEENYLIITTNLKDFLNAVKDLQK